MSIKIVIADDEPRIADGLARRLRNLWPEIGSITIVHDGAKALAAIEQVKPDIAFLDIRMPKMSGIEVAMHAQKKCHFVFVTAYDQHAIKAFDMGAIDYVVKPVNDARLGVTVERLQERILVPPSPQEDLINTLAVAQSFVKFIKASGGTNMYLIPVGEVFLFRKEGRYTQLVTEAHSPLVKYTLKELETMLDPGIFWRVRSAAIININYIEKIIAQGRDGIQVFLKGLDEPIHVSRNYAHKFNQF